MSRRQLEGKASIAACVHPETTASAPAKPHRTYGKTLVVVLDNYYHYMVQTLWEACIHVHGLSLVWEINDVQTFRPCALSTVL